MTDTRHEILLVEDNPKDVELTLHAFKRANLANPVLVAHDGAEALSAIFGPDGDSIRLPRLILLDLKMPKISGMEVLRRIKGDARTRNIPVVVLTSSTQEQDMEECYRLGVNSYLQKPVDFNEFVERAKAIGLYWLLMNRVP